MTRVSIKICQSALGLLLLFSGSTAEAGMVIVSDTTWSGDVAVTQDVLVPEGVTLTVAPGAKVLVTPAESTRTDPEFLSPLTEIMVRGTLVTDGKEDRPVSFAPAGGARQSWAGIVVDGGKVVMRSAAVSGAETGVHVFRGALSMNSSVLSGNRYGLVVQGPEAEALLAASQVKENDYGILSLNGAKVDTRETLVKGNRKKDTFASSAKDLRPAVMEYSAAPKETSRVFGNEPILGLSVWRNRVEVNGIVRVPEGSRLIILPGTVVEFRRRDTNRDGIGEYGLIIQGTIIAKGTPEAPIIFRSAEKRPRMGDWDSINIMNSDASQNLIEYCQIQDAYRGLHFHFSNVAVTGSVLKNNYRGVQFQESTVSIRGTHFYGNKSAFQARDSEVLFDDNIVHRNYSGMNVFRDTITLSGSMITNNDMEGVRVREGLPVVEKNLIDGNRHGLMVSDAFYGAYASNVISHNLESGISLRGTEGIEISGNAIQANGINGINIQDAGALIRGNLISDNAERGVGVMAFRGGITGNNIVGNGSYNLGVDGPADVSAAGNWWGGGDIHKGIYDKEDDPARGRAACLPALQRPAVFAWPLQAVRSDAAWRADTAIEGRVEVLPGATLTVSPGTRVLMGRGAGLTVKGRILARGGRDGRISFSSQQGKGAGQWDEILLDHAVDSVFSDCSFEDATWAIHSHFTDLRIEGCAFRNNEGGLRFTSGPIRVSRSLFEANGIGIRAFRGSALITGNVITGNKVGIFVRERGGGLRVTKNNLFANAEYNIRNGDFNDEDVDARDNWWGGATPADTLYDARREPGIGTVIYEPVAEGPFGILTSSESALPKGSGAGADAR